MKQLFAMIYIIDDDILMLKVLESNLKKSFPNIKIEVFSNPKTAFKKINRADAVCIVDYEMEPFNGFELVKKLSRKLNKIEFIMMSSLGKDELNKFERPENVIDCHSKDEKLLNYLKSFLSNKYVAAS